MGQRSLYRDPNLQIIFFVTLMAVLGVSSITPAFPKIVRELNVSSQAIGLLITVFTLPGVFLTPVLGVLADRFGRKKILVPSLFLFGLAGGACAFTQSFNVLLIFRFLQGVGAASLGSINTAIVGDLYSDKERIVAMGYNASVLSIGTATYPALGGTLAIIGWNYPFFLPLMAIPVGVFVLLWLKNPEPENKQSFKEYLKNALQSVKNRQVIGLFIASIITFIILYGPYLTYFPLLLGHSFAASSLVIGVLMSSMSLTTALTASQLGKLSKIFSERTLIKAAFFLYSFALLLITFVPKLWVFLVPTIIFGIAQGINIPHIQTLLAGLAPMEYRAAFMSINGTVLRLGQTLGPVIMGIIFGFWGIEGVFYSGAGFSIAMFVIMLIMIR